MKKLLFLSIFILLALSFVMSSFADIYEPPGIEFDDFSVFTELRNAVRDGDLDGVQRYVQDHGGEYFEGKTMEYWQSILDYLDRFYLVTFAQTPKTLQDTKIIVQNPPSGHYLSVEYSFPGWKLTVTHDVDGALYDRDLDKSVVFVSDFVDGDSVEFRKYKNAFYRGFMRLNKLDEIEFLVEAEEGYALSDLPVAETLGNFRIIPFYAATHSEEIGICTASVSDFSVFSNLRAYYDEQNSVEIRSLFQKEPFGNVDGVILPTDVASVAEFFSRFDKTPILQIDSLPEGATKNHTVRFFDGTVFSHYGFDGWEILSYGTFNPMPVPAEDLKKPAFTIPYTWKKEDEMSFYYFNGMYVGQQNLGAGIFNKQYFCVVLIPPVEDATFPVAAIDGFSIQRFLDLTPADKESRPAVDNVSPTDLSDFASAISNTPADPTPFPWLWVIVPAGVILVGGGTAALLLLRKRKKAATE